MEVPILSEQCSVPVLRRLSPLLGGAVALRLFLGAQRCLSPAPFLSSLWRQQRGVRTSRGSACL